MSDASSRPTRRAARETHTDDLQIGQAPDVIIPATGPIEHVGEVVEPLDQPLESDYNKALLFNEEYVTVQFNPSTDKNPARHIFCQVNGRGAEVMVEGRPMILTYLPIGPQITMKRKYLEVLARAKPDNVTTNVVEHPGQDPLNLIQRHTSMKYPFSILHDPNPKGGEWISRLLADR